MREFSNSNWGICITPPTSRPRVHHSNQRSTTFNRRNIGLLGLVAQLHDYQPQAESGCP